MLIKCNREDVIQVGDKVYVIDIIVDKDQDDDLIYKYRTRNSANQYIEMQLCRFKHKNFSNEYAWSVLLYVNKKSKGYEYRKQTGKSGIESLLVAKEILKYHIDCCIEWFSWHKNDHTIYIWADDNKRFKVYARGLKDIGFIEGKFYGQKCLYKKLSFSKA